MKKQGKTFQGEIKRSFLQYALVPIAILFVLFCLFSFLITRLNTLNNNRSANVTVSGKVLKACNSYFEQTRKFAQDPTICSYLCGRADQSIIYRLLYDFNNSQKLKCVFYLTDAKGKIKATNALRPDYDYENESLSGSSFYEKMEQLPDETVFGIRQIQYSDNRNSLYSFGRAVKENGRVMGYVFFDTLSSGWAELTYTELSEKIAVTDQFDNLIFSSDALISDNMGKFRPAGSAEKIVLRNQTYFYIENVLKAYGIHIYTISPVYTTQFMLYIEFGFLIFCCLLIFFITLCMADYMSKRNAGSLNKLVFAVKQFEQGNLNYRIELQSNDEFFILAQEYNKMVQQLSELIWKNREAADRQRITEIAQLEEQFNPHFIFNVLETIKCMVLIGEKKDETVQVITSLAGLLRYSINREKSIVLFQDDIKYLQDYLLLQKIRFGEKLEYHITVDDGVTDCMTPKLLMQPFVENCLKYGYVTKNFLKIDIAFCVADNDLFLYVKDNGEGIKPEKADAIKRMLQCKKADSAHLGMYNVHRRVQLLYGEKYGVEFRTEEGKGTEICVKIPARREHNDV